MERSERRRHGRHPYYSPVVLERPARPGGTFALARNVSLGGAAFSALEPMGSAEPVRATFKFDGEFVVADGRVAWERQAVDGRFECGVTFTHLDQPHGAIVRRARAT
jgi:hypothetical protein